jgi:hypothetical protein
LLPDGPDALQEIIERETVIHLGAAPAKAAQAVQGTSLTCEPMRSQLGGGLQGPGVVCGPAGTRGPPPVLQDMKTPEEVISRPELEDVDVERINFALRQIAETLSKVEDHTVYVGGPARFSGDTEDVMWVHVGGKANQRDIFLAKYWNVIRSKLEVAGWELARARRWLNEDHPYMRGYIVARYWRVRPSLDSFLNVSASRHVAKERTMCEEMGVPEMGETQ